MEQFIKIPIEFLQLSQENLKFDKATIHAKLMTYIFLEIHLQIFDDCSFTLEELAKFLGLKTNNSQFLKTKIYQAAVTELKQYISNGNIIIYNGNDIDNFKTTQLIQTKYKGLPPYNISQLRFIKLTQDEYDTLIRYSNNPIKPSILFTYLFIKSWIYIRPANSVEDVVSHPEYCYLSQRLLCESCKISGNTMSKILNKLENDYKLIASKKPNNIRKNIPTPDIDGVYLNMSTVYVLRTEDWELELESGVNKYTKQIYNAYTCAN